MINTEPSSILFLQKGGELELSIHSALQQASSWILEGYGYQGLDLARVSTKHCIEAALPAYIERSIVRNKPVRFNEQYVRDVFSFANTEASRCSEELYVAVTRHSENSKIARYRRSFIRPLRRGFSAFLVALHIRRAIVLPYDFKWPKGRAFGSQKATHKRREVCPLVDLPELLKFIRAIDYRESAEQLEEVFYGYTAQQRERFVYMGQHIIIAAGWLDIGDVSYKAMLELKAENDLTQFSGYKDLNLLMLAGLFEKKYGAASPVNVAGWRAVLADLRINRKLGEIDVAFGRSQVDVASQATSLSPSSMVPERMAKLRSVPGLSFDLRKNADTWISLERTYLRKNRSEIKKRREFALGYLNIYLFGYLPYWYAENEGFAHEFPSEPVKLTAGVFVSDLGLLDGRARPMTLVEFLDEMSRVRKWKNTTHYGILKQVEKFFEFLERFNNSIPNCLGFRQPLHQHDYPRHYKSVGTNKRPVPRRLYRLFLVYVEAIVQLSNILLERIVDGSIGVAEMTGLDPKRNNIINCFDKQDAFGYCPIIIHQGKTYPLHHIPNVLNIGERRLKSGLSLRIPQPHALHQIVVALYTGIRHNHIQWLDAINFDVCVDDESGSREYAELHVNTDKVMPGPWRPYVNFEVIRHLRNQRNWRELVDGAGFQSLVYYNNNPDTKWGSFLPLFSYYSDGSPHSDSLYYSCWMGLLGGLQGLLHSVEEPGRKLVRLLPAGVAFADPELVERLQKYGALQEGVCRLKIKSDITPHSARVSVVSHTITVLPADIIGRRITGQTPATVYHYVVPDEDDTIEEQLNQKLALRQLGFEKSYKEMLASSPGTNDAYIKANDVNSSLSRGLRSDFAQTIKAFGCVSLSFGVQEKSGLDILMETRTAGAVENKTEICPYGNQCPAEVVLQLKGWRRCGPCGFAVRSIDHLPAISTKIHQVLEGLVAIECRIEAADQHANVTPDELDALEQNRDVLAEDLASWQMAAEVLEVMRRRIAAGQSTARWHVQKPEIIEKDLRRALFPTNTTEYVLARLAESVAYPMLESSEIRAKFEMLRRRLLANSGNIRQAFSLECSPNPAAECVGLIRAIAAAHKFDLNDLKDILESDELLISKSDRQLKLIEAGDVCSSQRA